MLKILGSLFVLLTSIVLYYTYRNPGKKSINVIKVWILLTFVVSAFLLFFYRFPTERQKSDSDAVYSPAYGKIMKITKRPDNTTYIAIFLSPLDIHYQFFPVSGKVTSVQHDANGKFELAYELNKSNDNEKCIHVIENGHGEFTVYQIAGFLVRRISPYDSAGQKAVSGKCMGLIEFGSRVDIIIPQRDRFKLNVKEGDVVNGLDTVLGRFH
jgi:phosphatidylserine decarboxylase